jgi:hypothetical protein
VVMAVVEVFPGRSTLDGKAEGSMPVGILLLGGRPAGRDTSGGGVSAATKEVPSSLAGTVTAAVAASAVPSLVVPPVASFPRASDTVPSSPPLLLLGTEFDA